MARDAETEIRHGPRNALPMRRLGRPLLPAFLLVGALLLEPGIVVARSATTPAPGAADRLHTEAAMAEAAYRRRATVPEQDPLHASLRAVLCRIARDRCAGLRLYLLDGGGLELRVSPDGAIVVHGGALLRLRDEDELALLFGHEIAHVEAGHALAQRQADSHRARTALARRHEREADVRGRELASAAGYDPSAGATLWMRYAIEAAAARPVRGRPPLHPTPAERAAGLPLGQAGPRPSAARYRAAMEPHLERWLLRALDEPDLEATIAMLDSLHREAPSDWQGRTGFALGEAHRRRGSSGDGRIASRLIAQAARATDAPAAAFRELAHLRCATGDDDGARQAFRRYLALAPDAEDRAFVAAALGGTVPDGTAPPQAGTTVPLRVLADIAPREHLLARRRVDRRASPGGWFDPRLRHDEWPRMLMAALRDAGWVDLEARTIRPQRFGTREGVRFEFRMAHPDGTPHAGAAAMLLRHGRLTLAYGQAPLGPDHDREAANLARRLDSLHLP